MLIYLLISDNNVSGRLNLMALYEGFTFITKYDEINTKIEGLKSNTEYTLKINYVYDFDDGYGSRELTKEYTFKTLKQEPTYSLEFSNISKHGFDLIHNINDKDSALKFKEIEISFELKHFIKSVSEIIVSFSKISSKYTEIKSGKLSGEDFFIPL